MRMRFLIMTNLKPKDTKTATMNERIYMGVGSGVGVRK
jgi:hypothetical protein